TSDAEKDVVVDPSHNGSNATVPHYVSTCLIYFTIDTPKGANPKQKEVSTTNSLLEMRTTREGHWEG
ncbi:hypothetical protein PAXRUDRAFT_179603, partial [Paxillus rubicundulus Ve08.2h10]